MTVARAMTDYVTFKYYEYFVSYLLLSALYTPREHKILLAGNCQILHTDGDNFINVFVKHTVLNPNNSVYV